MKKPQGATAMLATWAASMVLAANAGEVEVPALKSYDTLLYRLVTHDEYTASHIPGQTARIDAFLAQQFATPVHSPRLPTTILVIPEKLARRYFEKADDAFTDFVPARFANYLLVKHSRNSNVVRNQLFHLYTHAFLRSQLNIYCPLWLEEGLATLVSTTRFDYTKMYIGMPARFSGPWIPLDRLFRLDRSAPEYLSENQSGAVYFGSWSLIHLAFIEDPAFNQQLFTFLAALNNFNPIEKAVPQGFGMSIEDLDRRMRRYVQQATFDAFFEVKIPAVPDPRTPPGRSMSEAESLTMLAEAMFAAGTRPERLVELVDAAQAKAPESPKVLALRMQLAVRDRDDAALARLLAENESRLADPHVARAVGLALFERVREQSPGDTLAPADRERFTRRAFDLLDRAVMSKPEDIEAIWGYSMLAARLRLDLDGALRRLDSGLAISEHNPDLALATALVYEAQGKQQEMVPFLVVAARKTPFTADREWALARVNAILASQAPASNGK